jgi:type IV secretion system protein VirD4
MRRAAVQGGRLLVALVPLMLLAGSGMAASPYGAANWDPDLMMREMTPHGVALYAGRIGQLVLSAGIGFLCGALFSPKLRPFRRLIGLALALLFGVGGGLFCLFGPFPVADFANGLLAVVLFLAAVGFGLRLGATRLGSASAPRRPTSLGSAKWATPSYVAEKGLCGGEGMMLGGIEGGGGAGPVPLHYHGTRHLLTVAPTRSGKGVSSIIPNLLTYRGSVLVVDPKGENALVTALRRGNGWAEAGITGLRQPVHLLDPWDVAASRLGLRPAAFNPLDWIDANDPDAAENAFLLADALVVSEEGQGETRFWDEEAKALLVGLILYVATAPAEQGQRTLGRLRDLLTLEDRALNEVWQAMYQHPHPIVKSTAARISGKDARQFSNLMATVQSHTHFLDSPRIRDSLSRSDFHFEDLKSTAVSLYLILPADRLKTFDRWLRLLVQQAITVNARRLDAPPSRPILFLLDEMAALGRLPALEQAYGLMAGFGMQIWGIIQDLSQLARVYGEHGWQTFISNSGVVQYFGSRDKMTAEYFSTLCGVTTVELHTVSWAVGWAVGVARSYARQLRAGALFSDTTDTTSSNQSDTWTRTNGSNEAQRHLAYPDELMVLKDNQQIIFVENLDPIPGVKFRWFEDPLLSHQGINLLQSDRRLPHEAPAPSRPAASPPPAAAVAPARVPPVTKSIRCESCGAILSMRIDRSGVFKCPKCGGRIEIAAPPAG